MLNTATGTGSHGVAERVNKVMHEREQSTMKFVRAARYFRMSVRGRSVLHVARPGSKELSVDPIIEEAVQKGAHLKPEVIHAFSASHAKRLIEEKKTDIRIAVIEVDLDYPGEGIALAKWARKEHTSLPVLLSTSREADVKSIQEEVPYVDVFLARSMTTSELMQLFGYSSVRD